MATVTVKGRLVNKANTYVIHKSAAGRLWIAPSDEAKAYEALVAWEFLRQERREWTHGEPLSLSIRLVNQRHDCDAIKAIGDGIQRSGRIGNDKQFRRITIEHVDGRGEPAVEIEVEMIYDTQ